MNLTTKRHIASWVLLAVFVPMLVLSSLHVHEKHDATDKACAECVAHHCHGHLGQADASLDACVLCQFLSLTFVAAATMVVTFIFNVLRFRYALQPSVVCTGSQGLIVTRGPPSVYH